MNILVIITLTTLPAFYVHHTKEYWVSEMRTLRQRLVAQQNLLKELARHSEKDSSLFFHRLTPLDQFFKDIAAKNQLKTDKVTLLPSETVFRDAKGSVLKTPVRVNFVVAHDQHVWSFLDDVHAAHAGGLCLGFLAIERTVDAQGQVLLKGVMHGDWYHVTLRHEGDA